MIKLYEVLNNYLVLRTYLHYNMLRAWIEVSLYGVPGTLVRTPYPVCTEVQVLSKYY